MTQELQIVNSLIGASECLRRLYPDTYDNRSRDVQGCIREVMEARQLDVLPATLKLMEVAREKDRENHITGSLPLPAICSADSSLMSHCKLNFRG